MARSEMAPYAYEFGRSNGDGTYSVFIERYLRDAIVEQPIKPLYAYDVVEALQRQVEALLGQIGGGATDAAAAWQTRERDLLDANNRYLERARAAEARARQLEGDIHERLARLEAQAHPPVAIEPIVRGVLPGLLDNLGLRGLLK